MDQSTTDSIRKTTMETLNCEWKKEKSMSNKNEKNNVVNLITTRCLAEGCKKKPSKADFCDEHYEWFKTGLITKTGEMAKDFDKKYSQFQNRNKKVA